jgi:hypothetical protein
MQTMIQPMIVLFLKLLLLRTTIELISSQSFTCVTFLYHFTLVLLHESNEFMILNLNSLHVSGFAHAVVVATRSTFYLLFIGTDAWCWYERKVTSTISSGIGIYVRVCPLMVRIIINTFKCFGIVITSCPRPFEK